jgi:hypothetical protein
LEFNFCVLCLDDKLPLSEEHIFPESAGGRLKKPILCETCNSKIGNYIDVPFLDLKHIQLARSILQIPSKQSGNIPIAFDDTYTANGINGPFKMKLDNNFQPIAIPQAPNIQVNGNDEISISLSRDKKYSKEIPKIIKTTLSRFFRTEEGKNLEWTTEEQEAAIEKAMIASEKIQPSEQNIQFPIEGKWEISLSPCYAEFVKIIYEICCIESKGTFPNTASGQKMRNFLTERFMGKSSSEFDIKAAASAINVNFGIPEEFEKLFERITNYQLNLYHLALVGRSSVAVYMFGMGACFQSPDFLHPNSKISKVYLNRINGSHYGIFDLEELIPSFIIDLK